MINAAYISLFLLLLGVWLSLELKIRMRMKIFLSFRKAVLFSIVQFYVLFNGLMYFSHNNLLFFNFFANLYDCFFSHIFIGFNGALQEFVDKKPNIDDLMLMKIKEQKVIFSSACLVGLISGRNILFSSLNYHSGYKILRKFSQVFNQSTEPINDKGVYLFTAIVILFTTILIGSYSEHCLSLAGCVSFGAIPTVRYALYPYIVYIYLSYVCMYLFLICHHQSTNKKI